MKKENLLWIPYLGLYIAIKNIFEDDVIEPTFLARTGPFVQAICIIFPILFILL